MSRILAGLALLMFLATGVVAAQSAPPRKDIPAIAKAANGSIVSVVMSGKDGKPVAQGSGFFVSKDGFIVTNYHVIAEGDFAVADFPDGTFYIIDGVVASDKDRDVAILKARGHNFRPLKLGNSDRVQVGEEVVAIGNPLSLESTVSNGIVSGIRSIKEKGGKYLQTTAPISPGSSGGPLFNMSGEVVGITTMYLKGGENLNFAIPVNDAKRLLRSSVLRVTDNEQAEWPKVWTARTVQTWDEARRYCSAHPNRAVVLDVIFTCTVVNRYGSEPSELDLAIDKYDQKTDSFGASTPASQNKSDVPTSEYKPPRIRCSSSNLMTLDAALNEGKWGQPQGSEEYAKVFDTWQTSCAPTFSKTDRNLKTIVNATLQKCGGSRGRVTLACVNSAALDVESDLDWDEPKK